MLVTCGQNNDKAEQVSKAQPQETGTLTRSVSEGWILEVRKSAIVKLNIAWRN